MSSSDGFAGISNCYVFKSRLQEYAQKVGIPTPIYETIKEGPSHEPSFWSTVIVNGVRYDSLPGFFNRKASEQSAAEVALQALAHSGETGDTISQPVHATGLCKNLLQEYAQKMNYAIPSYDCQREDTPGRVPHFSCTVEIGGIKYIGAAARTKKEAEIKAARTALLAIQSTPSGVGESERSTDTSMYLVLPCKKKVADLGISTQETAAALQPKKGRLKRRHRKKTRVGNRGKNVQGENLHTSEVNTNVHAGTELGQTDAFAVHAIDTELLPREAYQHPQHKRSSDGNVEVAAIVPYIIGEVPLNVYESE